MEIRVLLLNKVLGIPALLERDWGRSLPALRRYRWQSRLKLGPYMLGGGAPWIEALLACYAGRNTAPNLRGRGLERREEELLRPAMVEWISVESALVNTRGGKVV